MSLYVNLISTFDDKGLKQADGAVGTTESKLGKFGKAAGAAFAAAGVAAAGFAVTIAVDAVNAASDFAETISKSNVIFGEASKQVQDFADNAAASLGQTKQQALDAASTFAVFGKSAGLAGNDLAKFSTDFTVLASDLASFNNTTPEEAIQAIGAALRGESEPLRRYGVLLDDATMRQKAFELGIISSTKEALTPANKVLAAQALIYEQTKDAQGDFARTSDGLANQQRILTAEFENFKISLGEKLLPVVLKLVTFVKDNFLPLLQNLSTEVGKKLQPVIETLSNYWTGTLYPILKKVWELFQRDLLPIIQETADFVSDVFNEVFGDMGNQTDLNAASVEMLAKFFIDTLKPAVTGITTVIKGLALVIGGIIKGIQGTVEAINNGIAAFNRFKEGVSNSVNTIKKRMEEIGDAIRMPFKVAFREVAKWWNSTIGKFKITIPDWIPIIGGKTFSFPQIPVPELANGGIVKARQGGTLALIGEGGRDEAVIPLPKGKRMDSIMGGGITINVSGALDPEAVARQIETILKRSRLRAGNYA